MIRAVICDDEDAALKIKTYSIENQGIPIEIVGTASDGKEALALIKKEKTSLTCFWWAGMDSNHRTHTRTDLQSAAFSHSAICPFSHLKNNKWCTLKDSNLGPTGYEPVALTN